MSCLVAFLIGIMTGWLSIISLSLAFAASKADQFQEQLGREADEHDAFEEIRRRLEEDE